jgi:hypothetical protein
MIFASKTAQQLQFVLGGLKFTSRRLTAEEDLVYEDVKLRGNFVQLPRERIEGTTQTLAVLLGHRTDAPVNPEWVAAHMNAQTEGELMAYLRTGHNGPGLVLAPDHTFDLPEISLEIADRFFKGPLLSYADEIRLSDAVASSADIADELHDLDDETMTAAQQRQKGLEVADHLLTTRRATTAVLAELLNERDPSREAEDYPGPVTGTWLLTHMTKNELDQLQMGLRLGDLVEVDSPKDPTPANLPISG